MKMLKAALAGIAALLLSTPLIAQGVKTSALPSASPLTGLESVQILQGGAGCATTSGLCNRISTVAQIVTAAQKAFDPARYQFGAKGDARIAFVSTTSGSTTATGGSGTFQSSDVGKIISLPPAIGVSGGPQVTTITAVASTGSATLASAASATATNIAASIGTDDFAALQAYVSSCQGQNFQNPVAGTLVIRAGAYLLSQGLTAGCSIAGEATGTILRAVAVMPALVTYGTSSPVSFRSYKATVSGLTFDQNDLAAAGLWFRQFAEPVTQRLIFKNIPAGVGLLAGDPATSGAGGFGLNAYETASYRDQGVIPTGSTCILLDTDVSDSIISGGAPRDCAVGVVVRTSNNKIMGLHSWANGAYGAMTTCFDSTGGNFWSNNEEDSCTVYGFRSRGTGDSFIGNNAFNSANGAYATNNTTIAFHFDNATPAATIIGNRVYGNDSSHTFAKDYDNNTTSGLNIFGNTSGNVTTIMPTSFANYQASGGNFNYVNNVLNFSSGSTQYIQAPNTSLLIISASPTNPSKVQIKSALVLSPAGVGNTVAVGNGGELIMEKISPTATAPGAGNLRLAVGAGTTTGTCKIVAYAGTSTTPTTIADNIGGGC